MFAQPDSVARSRFEQAYQALVTRVLAGEQFELPVSSAPQLEHQRPRQITALGDAKVHLKVLRDKLGLRVRGLLRDESLKGTHTSICRLISGYINASCYTAHLHLSVSHYR